MSNTKLLVVLVYISEPHTGGLRDLGSMGKRKALLSILSSNFTWRYREPSLPVQLENLCGTGRRKAVWSALSSHPAQRLRWCRKEKGYALHPAISPCRGE